MILYRAHTWPHEQTERTGRRERKRENTAKERSYRENKKKGRVIRGLEAENKERELKEKIETKRRTEQRE